MTNPAGQPVIAPALGIGHNNMLADMNDRGTVTNLLIEAEELAKVVDAWCVEVPIIEDQLRAAECADLLDRISAAKKAAEDARTAEKRPHLDANSAIDEKYRPIKDLLKAAGNPIERLLHVWIGKVRDRKNEAARAAREAADKALAEAVAAKAKSISIKDQVAADRALRDAASALVQPAETANIKGTMGGRAKTIRTTWSASVTNFPLACRHYLNHPGIIEALEQLASAEARGGVRIIPGFKIESKEHVS